MDLSLYSPLEYYEKRAAGAYEKNVRDRLDGLVTSSGVSVAENRKTVADYKAALSLIEKLKSKRSKYNVFKILLIILGAIAIAAGIFTLYMIIPPIVLGVVAVICFVLAFGKLRGAIKALNEKIGAEEARAAELLGIAWRQMEPLNRAFDDGITFELIEKTMPEISFDKRFTPGKLKYLEENYSFENSDDDCASVTDTVSGSLLENPFLFERELRMNMGSCVYHGELLIRWTTYERTKNGMRAVTKTQLLHASVVKPKPEYSTATRLNYGHQAAPELNFTRAPSDVENMNDKKYSKYIDKGERELKKISEKSLSEGKNFTPLANTEFEVAYRAYDRDNEQQFRLLFTPLSQLETVKLLRSSVGYGDDFSFTKRGMLNLIVSEHMQRFSMDTSAKNYYSYDIDEIRNKFTEFNKEYFRSVYFDFAPLLAIPAYQAEPVASMEPYESEFHYTAKEYETLVNKIGESRFAHENSATRAILKTVPIRCDEKSDTVEVIAYSFAAVKRMDYVPTFGGDGRMHAVPVPWIEYVPLVKRTTVSITELDMSETAFGRRIEAFENVPPCACYHGLLAKIDEGAEGEVSASELAERLLQDSPAAEDKDSKKRKRAVKRSFNKKRKPKA